MIEMGWSGTSSDQTGEQGLISWVPSLPIHPSRAEHALVKRSKSGDHAAFTELIERSSPTAMRAIRRVMYNHADAEDVLQETFLKAFAKLGTFDERSAFSTWLTRIAINCAFMVLRRKRCRREISLEMDSNENSNLFIYPVISDGVDQEKTYLRNHSIKIVRDAIRRLPVPLRQHAEWRCLEEKSHKDIAASIGISLASSKSRTLRVKLRLLRMLKAIEGAPPTRRARTTSL